MMKLNLLAAIATTFVTVTAIADAAIAYPRDSFTIRFENRSSGNYNNYNRWHQNNQYRQFDRNRNYNRNWNRNQQFNQNRIYNNTYDNYNRNWNRYENANSNRELRYRINEIYLQVLGRNADANGTQHYINLYYQGWSLGQIHRDIANSQEARGFGYWR